MKPHHVRQRPDAGHAKWGQGIGASLHITISELLKSQIKDVPGSSGVKNSPSNSGDIGSIDCGGDGGGGGIALAITTLRFPVITRGPVVLCEAAWAVAAPGGSRPCCPVTSWSGDTPLEVPRSQPSEWTGGPPAARVLASGGRLPRQLPLPSGVYFGSVLLRFSPGIAGSVRAGPRLEVTLLK